MDSEQRTVHFLVNCFIAGIFLCVLVAIQQELESIANSLKVLASPPQIEERF